MPPPTRNQTAASRMFSASGVRSNATAAISAPAPMPARTPTIRSGMRITYGMTPLNRRDDWAIAPNAKAWSMVTGTLLLRRLAPRGCGPVERDTSVAQRHESVVPDDEMVEERDVEQAARRDRLRREMEVIGTGRRIARWMVVDEDHPGRIESDRVPKQLPDPHEGRRHVALVDGGDAQDVVLRIKDHDAQLLALETAHLQDQAIGDVARSADQPAGRRPVGEQPSTEFEGGHELSRLRRADARDTDQLQVGRTGETGETVVRGQRVGRQFDGRPATDATAP